jgi:hypothetical protein
VVRIFQEARARRFDLPSGFGPIRLHERYAQMFRLIHLDRAIRSRFPGRAPRGLIAAVEAAVGEYLGGVSVEHVHRLRTTVAACCRGERAATERRHGQR